MIHIACPFSPRAALPAKRPTPAAGQQTAGCVCHATFNGGLLFHSYTSIIYYTGDSNLESGLITLQLKIYRIVDN
jgi:hypothetical protein